MRRCAALTSEKSRLDPLAQVSAQIVDNPEFDAKKAQGKIGGAARAMVATNGIARAIQYYHTISDCLQERKSCGRVLR